MQINDLAGLPLRERLAAMELLWDSLRQDPAHDPSPAWHAELLEQRRRELTHGESISWEDAKLRLRALADGKSH